MVYSVYMVRYCNLLHILLSIVKYVWKKIATNVGGTTMWPGNGNRSPTWATSLTNSSTATRGSGWFCASPGAHAVPSVWWSSLPPRWWWSYYAYYDIRFFKYVTVYTYIYNINCIKICKYKIYDICKYIYTHTWVHVHICMYYVYVQIYSM
jgi:hypothetical protein